MLLHCTIQKKETFEMAQEENEFLAEAISVLNQEQRLNLALSFFFLQARAQA